MGDSFYKKQLNILKSLSPDILDQITRGIEKENIRTDASGNPAITAHPKQLGAALTHPSITTDFSENLLEVITPAISGPSGREKLFKSLRDITAFVNNTLSSQLDDKEYLWPYSMPYLPNSDSTEEIAIADYGSSNIGKMKKAYRQGLVNRYGKAMQMISGLHYNFSFPKQLLLALGPLADTPQDSHLPDDSALITQRYLGVFRNFLQYQWIIPFLFGASPVCFAGSLYNINQPCFLDKTLGETLISSNATSLRLSDIGYQNKSQAYLRVCSDKISNYATSLLDATNLPYPEFERFPIQDSNGEYQQLSANLLQIENEFYSTIRPKTIVQNDYRPAVALNKFGIEYLEIRSLDLNPFEPLGLSQETSAFLDLFLTYLLLQPSELITNELQNKNAYNFKSAVNSGRNKCARICMSDNFCKNTKSCATLTESASHLLQSMQELADVMDASESNANNIYSKSLQLQIDKVNDLNLLPSNQVIIKWQESGLEFVDFMNQLARKSAAESTVDSKEKAALAEAATASLIAQSDLEAKDSDDSTSFEEFLRNYFEQKL